MVLSAAWPAAAHGGSAHRAEFGWTLDPWVVVPLLVVSGLSIAGAARLYRRARRGRVQLHGRVTCLCLGLLCVAGALLSPLHAIGEALFTAHMIEHEIVMAVAAPLIVLARPLGILLFALPRHIRHRAGRAFRQPKPLALWRIVSNGGVATLLHGAVIWMWHLPALFDPVVETLLLHRLQHATFLLTALLFWWAVLWKAARGVAAWHLFTTMMHTSLLGALIALSPVVLYPVQTRLAPEFGLTPLEDQQMAGMLMWVPAGTVYAAAALYLIAAWIRSSGKEMHREASPL
ncbi:cytochrome c oxidase assembly protein [Gellertiella hungarica]|uniref:Cytochrome c oxidase assembly factor CtaG n=1 Tax=Gellertiella hungarica TaxID=1572859 RepID=A0A7W6J870_9HYPH|nr:cytochrome c oxidase assembly protein [Gellertiella hungarica]MBB4066585.1 cytochrome c oxidase assembly factor CtaG [Gellertiella hungarica]